MSFVALVISVSFHPYHRSTPLSLKKIRISNVYASRRQFEAVVESTARMHKIMSGASHSYLTPFAGDKRLKHGIIEILE
jgi:hypothetical protein